MLHVNGWELLIVACVPALRLAAWDQGRRHVQYSIKGARVRSMSYIALGTESSDQKYIIYSPVCRGQEHVLDSPSCHPPAVLFPPSGRPSEILSSLHSTAHHMALCFSSSTPHIPAPLCSFLSFLWLPALCSPCCMSSGCG